MKTPALGSLCALAILCGAPATQSAVVVSSTVINLGLPTSGAPSDVPIDIDGNGTTDFDLGGTFGNASNRTFTLIDNNGNNQVAYVTTSGFDFVRPFHPGDTVDFTPTFSNFGYLYTGQDITDSPATQHSFYAGVRFIAQDSLYHFGWLQFSFPAGGPNVVVTAAYDDLENTAIVVVPEPVGFGIAGAISLAAYAAYRRRGS